MTEREDTIERIERVLKLTHNKSITVTIPRLTAERAVSMLKEQEPVEVEIEGGGSTWWHVCGECHGPIERSDSFCKHCGRPVKQT